MSDTIGIRLGTVHVRISSNDEAFMAYTRSHFKPVLDEGASAQSVEVEYVAGERGDDEGALLSRYAKVGRGVFARDGETVWNSIPYFPGMSVRFSGREDKLTLRAAYKPVPTLKGKARRMLGSLSGQEGRKNQFYFELLYYLVYYPVFWILRNSDIFVLHGGGIEARGTGIVVVGAQGTGKSTLIANLLGLEGSRFLSDNLILYDGTRIYSCHEPIRIDDRVLGSVPQIMERIEKMVLDVPLGREAFNVQRESYVESMEPDVFIVPRMSNDDTGLRPLSHEEVIARARAFNMLADEVRNFEIFGSALCHLSGARAHCDREIQALNELLDGKRCYEMNIKFGEDPGETSALLLKAVEV